MFRTFLLFLGFFAIRCPAGEPTDHVAHDAVLAQLHAAAQKTVVRMTTEPIQWRSTITLPNGAIVAAMNTLHGDRARRELTIQPPGGSAQPFFTVVMNATSWTIREPTGPTRVYRPNEAVFVSPNAYAFLSFTDLALANTLPDGISCDSVVGQVANLRQRITGPMRTTLESTLGSFAKVAGSPEITPEALAMRDKLTRILAEGMEIRADLASGAITSCERNQMVCQTSDIRWPPSVDPALFELSGPLEQHSRPILEMGPMEDWVFFSYGALWRPGSPEKNPATEQVLFHLKTKEIRRIPVTGMACMTPVFSRDRTKIYTVVIQMGSSRIFPVEIDLRTGVSKELAVNDPDGFMYFDPCPSPDGTLIAIRRGLSADPTQKSQIGLIEVSTGAYRPMGEILGGVNLCWLPDATGILMRREEFLEMDKPSKRISCVMDLRGTIRDLIPGDHPIVLPSGRVLFQEPGMGLWKTCTLDGSQVEVCGDGLPRCNFPSLSPDGTRLLMIRFGDNPSGQPIIVSIATWTSTPVAMPPGLWIRPRW